MRKIIVPIDFSETSEFALEAAASISKKLKAELLVLHMLELSSDLLSKRDSEHQLAAAYFTEISKLKLKKFLTKHYLKKVKVTPIIKQGKVLNEINEFALKNDAELIVMGSHGASGVKEVFIGSNTQKVIRYSDIPVLVIKEKPKEISFDIGIFACDFSIENIKPYLEAKDMFKNLGTQLYLLYVNTPYDRFKSTNEIDEMIQSFLKNADGDFKNLQDVHKIDDYSVEKGIINFSIVMGVDIVAIPTHGRKGLSHFLEGSITEDISNHASFPVMTFKI